MNKDGWTGDGRPKVSYSPVVLQAANELFTPDRSPTRRELAAHLMMTTREIDSSVKSLTATGRLHQVRLRQVAHRTRPVAEYAPAEAMQLPAPEPRSGWEDLQRCMERCWR